MKRILKTWAKRFPLPAYVDINGAMVDPRKVKDDVTVLSNNPEVNGMPIFWVGKKGRGKDRLSGDGSRIGRMCIVTKTIPDIGVCVRSLPSAKNWEAPVRVCTMKIVSLTMNYIPVLGINVNDPIEMGKMGFSGIDASWARTRVATYIDHESGQEWCDVYELSRAVAKVVAAQQAEAEEVRLTSWPELFPSTDLQVTEVGDSGTAQPEQLTAFRDIVKQELRDALPALAREVARRFVEELNAATAPAKTPNPTGRSDDNKQSHVSPPT